MVLTKIGKENLAKKYTRPEVTGAGVTDPGQ